ncbi:MAG: hypothetical protein KGO96_07445 [Elusimicrobia bacterium]|nr:hypothetical protein [Elusimicrobiota bacterium]
MANQTKLTKRAIKEKLLFTPCQTKEHLKNWVKVFLNIDLPDCTVDPSSNSNPLDLMWEIYSKALEGKDELFTQILAYASRDSRKNCFCFDY